MNRWDKKNSFPGVSFEADAETKAPAPRSVGHNNPLSRGIFISIFLLQEARLKLRKRSSLQVQIRLT